ncbi:MAG: hypothetical protein K8R21_15650 [Leptospira sp.]|nr:hypothetical protein [Leptospira sp.]
MNYFKQKNKLYFSLSDDDVRLNWDNLRKNFLNEAEISSGEEVIFDLSAIKRLSMCVFLEIVDFGPLVKSESAIMKLKLNSEFIDSLKFLKLFDLYKSSITVN